MLKQAVQCPSDFLRTTQEDLPTGRPNFSCHHFFLFIWVFGSDPHQFPGAIPSLRSRPGLAEDNSGDVEDETPWNDMRFEVLRLADNTLPIPTRRSIRDLCKGCLATGQQSFFEQLHSYEQI